MTRIRSACRKWKRGGFSFTCAITIKCIIFSVPIRSLLSLALGSPHFVICIVAIAVWDGAWNGGISIVRGSNNNKNTHFADNHNNKYILLALLVHGTNLLCNLYYSSLAFYVVVDVVVFPLCALLVMSCECEQWCKRSHTVCVRALHDDDSINFFPIYGVWVTRRLVLPEWLSVKHWTVFARCVLTIPASIGLWSDIICINKNCHIESNSDWFDLGKFHLNLSESHFMEQCTGRRPMEERHRLMTALFYLIAFTMCIWNVIEVISSLSLVPGSYFTVLHLESKSKF